jgi:hypothetical protein
MSSFKDLHAFFNFGSTVSVFSLSSVLFSKVVSIERPFVCLFRLSGRVVKFTDFLSHFEIPDSEAGVASGRVGEDVALTGGHHDGVALVEL